jgi:hypothetical protein
MRAVAVALIAGFLLSSCGDDERGSAAATTTRFSDERRGFEITYPHSWNRAGIVLTPNLSDPVEILSVGTVRPVANTPSSACAQNPVETMARVGPRDVFFTILERTNQVSGEMRPGPPQLDAVVPDDSELPACLAREVPFKTYWMPFTMGGRGFYASAAVGDDVTPEVRAELQAALDSFHVAI